MARAHLREKTGAPQELPAAFAAFHDALGPGAIVWAPSPIPVALNVLIYLCMGVPDKLGEFTCITQEGRVTVC